MRENSGEVSSEMAYMVRKAGLLKKDDGIVDDSIGAVW